MARRRTTPRARMRAPPPESPRASVTFDTPIGRLHVEADSEAVRGVGFVRPAAAAASADGAAADGAAPPAARALVERAARELGEYFDGTRREFTVPVAPLGTRFQQRVWRALQRIPFGATASYGEIARAVGRPRAARAIGAANHVNPIAVIVPCHRVIGVDRSLVGYGGGLDKKEWLLRHEGASAVAGVASAPEKRKVAARAAAR